MYQSQIQLKCVGVFHLVVCGITCSHTGHSRTGGEADDIAACDGLDAYGNTLIFTGPGADGVWFTDDDVQSNYEANSIIYCGYRYDAETENYYVRNRYYSPVLGRWITRDPIGYEGGINLYGYVESSPTGRIDARGLFMGIGGFFHTIKNGVGDGLYWTGSQIAGAGSAIGSDVSTEAHLIAARARHYWRSAERSLERLEQLPEVAFKKIARELYKKYCHCKQRWEGAYIGVNVSGSFGGFDVVGAIGILGVQAIIICAAREVGFYWYAGAEGGVGAPVDASGSVIGGPTGGNGLYNNRGYTGWFVGGQLAGGPGGVGGAIGAYRSTDGSVVNWTGGLGYSTGGISLTYGGEYYFLLGYYRI